MIQTVFGDGLATRFACFMEMPILHASKMNTKLVANTPCLPVSITDNY